MDRAQLCLCFCITLLSNPAQRPMYTIASTVAIMGGSCTDGELWLWSLQAQMQFHPLYNSITPPTS